MKKPERRMLIALAVSWIVAGSSALAQSDPTQQAIGGGNQTPQEIEAHAPTATSEGNNSLLTTGPAEKGLTLNLRGVPLDAALRYLSEAAGFTIIREANTEVEGTVDIVSAMPLNKTEIVLLLNKVLAHRGLTALPDGQTLTIMSVQDAARLNLTPVVVWDDKAASIPQDARIVTEVISLHSLSPTQVAKDLASLLPPDAGLVANEGGNAIVMTARQADIGRFTQIIQALDSSGESDLEVFELEYADAKAIAQELKDVFAEQDVNANQGNPFQNLLGNRGGATGRVENSRRAAIRVNAVSDDQNNAILVSAPADIMSGISNLVHKLDIQQDDVLQIRVFALHHADATDVANQMASLFPDSTSQANPQNSGRGPGAQFVQTAAASSTGARLSDRRKKQATVIAVPDPRTQSVIITASKDTMVQIGHIIEELDSNAAGAMQVYVFRPEHTDVLDLQGPLSDLFRSSSQSATGSQVNILAQRASQAAQNCSPTSLSISSSAGGNSGGRSGQ
jgi:type II secretory pathway component GspD/PulD (secretin)